MNRLPPFEELVGVPDANGCWPWLWKTNKGGYGTYGSRGLAHRYAWAQAHGPIPAGVLIRHSCDNPPCVNPAHLLPGTDLDNAHDREERKRSRAYATHCAKGHEMTAENTQWDSRGRRNCRTCVRAKNRRAYLARKARGAVG